MKNIFQWLKKNLYVVLFLALEVLSIGLYFRYHQMQESAFFNFCTSVKGRCFSILGGERSRKVLLEENARLHDENARLRAQLENAWFDSRHAVSEVSGDTLYKQMYTYIEADVLNATFEKSNNYIILDAGRNEGVEPGMAVLSPKGIVGIVERVSAHFSSVISVLHSQSKVSVSLASSGYTGTLIWPGVRYDEALMIDVPSHIKVESGEKVVTSGLSLVYPGGVPVGFVNEIVSKKGANFYRLKLTFSEDYRCMDKVYVVKNLYKEELGEVN